MPILLKIQHARPHSTFPAYLQPQPTSDNQSAASHVLPSSFVCDLAISSLLNANFLIFLLSFKQLFIIKTQFKCQLLWSSHFTSVVSTPFLYALVDLPLYYCLVLLFGYYWLSSLSVKLVYVYLNYSFPRSQFSNGFYLYMCWKGFV